MRMNIYIPIELREAMRPFDTQLNWSKIAAEAFRAAISTAAKSNWS